MTGPNVDAIQVQIKRMLNRFPESQEGLFTLLGWTICEDDKDAGAGSATDAKALWALAAWSSVSSGRTVEWCCMECEWQCWLGTGKDYDLPVIGTGVSPAAASMDAISKAAAK